MKSLIRSILAFAFFSIDVFAVNTFAGITASNSAENGGIYTCRTQDQWKALFNNANATGFKAVRILGFDCDALTLASNAAASTGMQILAGIYFNGPVAAADGQIDNDVLAFQNAVKTYGADRYMGLTVGNENSDSPENIMNKVGQVRDTLRGAGISTPVSTVHTWVAVRDNNIFCNGDFRRSQCSAVTNSAYYDFNTPADQTGNWLIHNVVPMLRNTCPNKQIIITESGWPSAGNINGAAIPSLENEASSLLNLNCACRDDRSVSVFAFEYDDSLWKDTDVERSFGLFDKDVPKMNYNGDILVHC